jgi:DNA-binding response OmpR family regulator
MQWLILVEINRFRQKFLRPEGHYSCNMTNILLLDDEADLREEVAHYLRARHYNVTEVGSIRQFHQYFAPQTCDIAIVDGMLPDGDGLDLVSQLRDQNHRCGIIMFTARDASKDRINGYAMGVDHYITKPVRLEELAAVVKSLAWRVDGVAIWRLDSADWILKTPQHQPIRLTAMEHGFLMTLIKRPDKVHTRRQIVDALGKDSVSYDERNLDALILRLRKKVAEVTLEPLPVKTVHGQGYAITQSVTIV